MKKSKPFTLIELLVVISIMVILLSILFPALQSAKKSAQSLSCLNNLRVMGHATLLYANDNNGFLLPQWLYYSHFCLGGASVKETEMGLGALMWLGYVNQGKIFLCPLDKARAYQKLDRYTTANSASNASILNDSYTMQPTGTAPNDVYTSAVFKLDKPPKNPSGRKYPYSYMTDFFDVKFWWPNPAAHSGYNTFFIDGHVKFIKNRGGEPMNPTWDGCGRPYAAGTPTFDPWKYLDNAN